MRMLVPDDAPLSFVDLIRGEVSAPRPDDQVLLKADGFPTYHLAVVVDDGLMGITHVVRGEEWISSTPKHLLLADWLGFERPAYAHMPLLRNADKSKISKRKNPAARLTWFLEQGYLPEALRNFLGLLGYSLPSQEEVFTFEEMSRTFDWSRVNTVGPVFDLDKLGWLNGHYLRELRQDDFAARALPFLQRAGLVADPATPEQLAALAGVVPLVQTRVGGAVGAAGPGAVPVRAGGRVRGRRGRRGQGARPGQPGRAARRRGRARAPGAVVRRDGGDDGQRRTRRRPRAQAGQGVPAAAGCGVRRGHLAAAARSRWRCSGATGRCGGCGPRRGSPAEVAGEAVSSRGRRPVECSAAQVGSLLSPRAGGVWGNWQPDGFWFR